MLRLIKANATSARKLHFCNGTPPFFLNFRAFHVLLGEGHHFGFQIVAQKIKFVDTIVVGRMECRFRRGQGEDKPAVTGIHGLEAEYVAKKGAVSVGIFAVKNHVSARNHFAPSKLPETAQSEGARVGGTIVEGFGRCQACVPGDSLRSAMRSATTLRV